jgi:hypothetical protein
MDAWSHGRSIITLLHAASAAALRQKLVQFATVLHIPVLE